MPRVGSSKIRTLDCVKSHFARTTFCWFPPLRFWTGCSTRGRLDHQVLDVLHRRALLLALVHEAELRDGVQVRQCDVLAHGHAEDQAERLPILRHEADPELDRVLGRADVDRLAVQGDLARVDRVSAEDRPREFGPSCADESREAEHLALADLQVDVFEGALAVQSPDREHRLADLGGLLRDLLLQLAADHHVDHVIAAEVGDVLRADEAARRAGRSRGRRSRISPPAGARCR